MITERQVVIGGGRIEVIEVPGRSTGRPLVLLHEGLGSAGRWKEFPETLNDATDRRVLAFSRFGHGHSDPPAKRRTIGFHHEEALDVLPPLLSQLDGEEPILVGHSDGGSIAIIHAAHHPVAGLALLAPHTVVEEVTVQAIHETRIAYERGDLRERMARHHDDPDAAFWGWCDAWLHPAFRAWTIEDEVERVTAPTLLIQGADDPYGTLDQLDRIEARIHAPVERLVVPGGHSPHLEETETVVAAIAAFVQRLP
jgi:pimeloyl-ACP methyl ester carboxylesterase